MSEGPKVTTGIRPPEYHVQDDSDTSSGAIPEGGRFGRKIKEASSTDVQRLSDSASLDFDSEYKPSIHEGKPALKERLWETVKSWASLLPFVYKKRLNNVLASEDRGGVRLLSYKPLSEVDRSSEPEARSVKSTKKKKRKPFFGSEPKHVGDEIFKQAQKQKAKISKNASFEEREEARLAHVAQVQLLIAQEKLSKDGPAILSAAKEAGDVISAFTEWDETKLVWLPGESTKGVHGDPLRRVTTNLYGLRSLPPKVVSQLSASPDELLSRVIGGRTLQEWGNKGTFKAAVESGASLEQIKAEIVPVLDEVTLLVNEALAATAQN
ncbi:hypothetical protein ACWJJH_12310 [Endozoicomonadaceae bacterium StTr2]